MTQYHDLTNEVLVQLLQNNLQDELAFMTLLDRFKPLFTKMAYQMKIEGYEPEDIFQEGFIQLYLGIQYFDVNYGSYFAYYLKAVIMNRVFQLAKKDQKRKEVIQEVNASLEDLPYFESDFKLQCSSLGENDFMRNSPEEILMAQDTIRRFIDQLSDFEHDVMRYYLFRGMSVREIAEETGQDYNKVRHAVRRAKDKLNKLIHHE